MRTQSSFRLPSIKVAGSAEHALEHPTSPLRGVETTKFASWLVLVSEAMFFPGLIAAYIVLRLASPSWQVLAQVLYVPVVTFKPFILIISSVTIVSAYAAIEGVDQARLRRLLMATIAFGVMFLGIQGFE